MHCNSALNEISHVVCDTYPSLCIGFLVDVRVFKSLEMKDGKPKFVNREYNVILCVIYSSTMIMLI